MVKCATKTEAVENLIVMMGWSKATSPDDVVSAREAWLAFYERYWKRLTYLCRGCRDLKNVVQETFLRAKVAAGEFDTSKLLAADEDGKDRIVLSWLGKIARGVQNDERYFYPLPEEIVAHGGSKGYVVTGEKERLILRIKELWQTLLSEKEREILRETIQRYRPDLNRGSFLPTEILNELCVRLKTTKDNVRRIRKDAMDRLKAALMTEGLSLAILSESPP